MNVLCMRTAGYKGSRLRSKQEAIGAQEQLNSLCRSKERTGSEATPFEEDSGFSCTSVSNAWTGPVRSLDLNGYAAPFRDSRFGVSGMTCLVGTMDFRTTPF
ncbi:hypothetical protein F511_17202 [Dorcoceras hygrometricum]|uniref:Uncharacterized protein n=1 Tax=Dorcoceras hygrometricum TaxID=472368 RepID=A0A2Z7D3U5_9LAMI|nr:hypothetical protein F511_17202 [Dorcoceras hygrometricum]